MCPKTFAVVALLCCLLAMGTIAQAAPVLQATATYTPIPTRTPSAATQSVVVVTVAQVPAQISASVTAGDIFIVSAIAVIAAGLGIAFAYSWVKGHIRVQE